MIKGLPSGSDGKESAPDAGDPGLTPGSERFLGKGNGYPFQYSCLEDPMERYGGTWDSHVGKPRGKASWESLEGKPQIP